MARTTDMIVNLNELPAWPNVPGVEIWTALSKWGNNDEYVNNVLKMVRTNFGRSWYK